MRGMKTNLGDGSLDQLLPTILKGDEMQPLPVDMPTREEWTEYYGKLAEHFRELGITLSSEPLTLDVPADEPAIVERAGHGAQLGTINPEDVKLLLQWRDAALRTSKHLGMLPEEFGAYVLLCRAVGHVPEVGGRKRPDLLGTKESAG